MADPTPNTRQVVTNPPEPDPLDVVIPSAGMATGFEQSLADTLAARSPTGGGTEQAINEIAPTQQGVTSTPTGAAFATPPEAAAAIAGGIEPPIGYNVPGGTAPQPPTTLTRTERYAAAGFTPQEISDWQNSTRAKYLKAGFSNDEIDDYLGVPPSISKYAFNGVGRALVGPMWDVYAGNVNAPMGRILTTMGVAAKDGYGADTLAPVTDEIKDGLKKAGMWDSYQNSRTSIFKAMGEAFLRPIALEMQFTEMGLRGLQAAWSGVQGALGGTEQELQRAGHPVLAWPFGAVAEAMGAPWPELLGMHPGVPENITQAKAFGVLGGTAPDDAQLAETLRKQTEEARDVADKNADLVPPIPSTTETGAAVPPGTTGFTAATTPETAPIAPLDANQIARQTNPELFRNYDEAQRRVNNTRNFINELDPEQNLPQIDSEIKTLRDRLANGGVTKSQRADIASQLEDLQTRRERYLPSNQEARASTLNVLRQQLMRDQGQLNDLAPQVNAVYREASARLPPPEEPPLTAPSPTSLPQEAPETTLPLERQIANLKDELENNRTTMGGLTADERAARRQLIENQEAQLQALEQQRPQTAPTEARPATPKPTVLDIHNDAYQKLTAAGRSAELADAEAAIVEATYRARAAMFDGKKGTAGELYAAKAPDINWAEKGGRGGSASGKTRITNAGKTITLFEKADASTFVHEWGHHKLDEILTDAKDTEAPQSIKDDVSIIKKWLGVTGDEITRAQHEKFARGFERYLMEGVSPSQALAKVFGKFRQWLTDLYKSVKNKLPALNDDIRQVFDRMLAEPHKGEVIAPEHGMTPTEAHENLADKAADLPPEQAATRIELAADKVATETNAQDAGVADDLARRTGQPLPSATAGNAGAGLGRGATEAGLGEAAGEGIDRNGVRPEPAPGEAVGHPQHGEIGAGRGEATENGGRAPAELSARGNITPDVPFEQRGGEFLDKNGDIDFKLAEFPQDIISAVKTAVKDNDMFRRERRTTLGDAEVLQLANTFGTNPAFIDRATIGTAFNAEQLVWLRNQAVIASRKTQQLLANLDPGNLDDLSKFIEARDQSLMIQDVALGRYFGGRSEAGRSLRIIRQLQGSMKDVEAFNNFLRETSGQTLYQIQDALKFAKKLNTPEQLMKFFDKTGRGNLKHAIVYYYINSLLSGPLTHAYYFAGNMFNAAIAEPTQTILGAAGGSARVGLYQMGLMKEPINRIYWSEVGGDLYGLIHGAMEGWSPSIEAVRTGMSPLLPQENLGLARTPFGAGLSPISGVVGTAIGVPSRVISGLHTFSKYIRYEQMIQRLAVRQAIMEGLDGAEFKARITTLTSDPTEAMMDEATANLVEEMQRKATGHALRQNYMAPTDYHSLAGKLTRWTDESLLGKLLVPFIKIGSQLDRMAIENSPLTAATPKFWRELMSNSADTDAAMGRFTVGLGVVGGGVAFTLNKILTGDGPPDPKDQARWRLEGNNPNHLTIGNLSIPLAGLGWFGIQLHLIANMTESISGMNEKDHEFVASHLIEGITRGLVDETYLRDVKDVLDAIHDPDTRGKFFVSFVTNWLPYSVGMGQVARVIDPERRDYSMKFSDFVHHPIQTIFDAAKAKIPFASETLPPSIDMFGNPIPSDPRLPASIDTRYANDKAVQVLNRLQIGFDKTKPEIDSVSLTHDQFLDFRVLRGQQIKAHLDSTVNQPGFDSLPLHTQILQVDHAIESGTKSAEHSIKMKYPTLLDTINKVHQDLSRGHAPTGGYPQESETVH